jgi:hypothetical protein
MKEQSIPEAVSSSPNVSRFSNPGMGMPPATSSPVLRRRRDEGDPQRSRTPRRTILGPWRDAFRAVRAETERRAAPLSAEDQVVQSMADASPTKWHRAHTTWFFEQFLLRPHLAGYRVFDERFAYLFNSYYVAAGPRHARPKRGLSRGRTASASPRSAPMSTRGRAAARRARRIRNGRVVRILEIGLHHEQQHQELILTDILHAFAQNPLAPATPRLAAAARAARVGDLPSCRPASTHRLRRRGILLRQRGPAHRGLLQPCASRGLVTNAQWLDFMADGGYATPSLWLSDGWATVEAKAGTRPAIGESRRRWLALTLGGCSRSIRRARRPRELLRGGCLRALGRQALCRPRRNGRSRRAQTSRRRVRHRVAVDAQRYLPYPGYRAAEARSANTTASS